MIAVECQAVGSYNDEVMDVVILLTRRSGENEVLLCRSAGSV